MKKITLLFAIALTAFSISTPLLASLSGGDQPEITRSSVRKVPPPLAQKTCAGSKINRSLKALLFDLGQGNPRLDPQVRQQLQEATEEVRLLSLNRAEERVAQGRVGDPPPVTLSPFVDQMESYGISSKPKSRREQKREEPREQKQADQRKYQRAYYERNKKKVKDRRAQRQRSHPMTDSQKEKKRKYHEKYSREYYAKNKLAQEEREMRERNHPDSVLPPQIFGFAPSEEINGFFSDISMVPPGAFAAHTCNFQHYNV